MGKNSNFITFAGRMNEEVFIALGSNLGDSISLINQAYEEIELEVGSIIKKSSFYESEPWGFDAENNFVNTVIKVETWLDPLEIMEKLIQIESKLGRVRNDAQVYQSRTIDLDLLAVGNQQIKTETLEIPHPRMHLRAFVLVPFAEIEADWTHPIENQKIKKILEVLKDESLPKLIMS